MRRSDIKQIRRRLTCAALRVWESYTDVEKSLNITFMDVQTCEKALADNDAEDNELRFDDPGQIAIGHTVLRAQLALLRLEAENLSELLTWYKAGHEQLNAMIAVAEARAKELK